MLHVKICDRDSKLSYTKNLFRGWIYFWSMLQLVTQMNSSTKFDNLSRGKKLWEVRLWEIAFKSGCIMKHIDNPVVSHSPEHKRTSQPPNLPIGHKFWWKMNFLLGSPPDLIFLYAYTKDWQNTKDETNILRENKMCFILSALCFEINLIRNIKG